MILKGSFVTLVALVLFTLSGCCRPQPPSVLERPPLICHAGGALNREEPYRHSTNSWEAVDINYQRGFRFFELDFNWTSDGHLVVIHDWDQAVQRMFGLKEPRVLSLEAFTTLDYSYNTTQMTVEDLAAWCRTHPDAYIVTDIKQDNLRALALLAEKMGDIKARIVPQVYYFEEYEAARDLGFDEVILTLYLMGGRDKDIVAFAKCHRLFAVTMPHARGETGLPRQLAALGVKTYAHTVNQPDQQRKLMANGITGIYTDYIFPDQENLGFKCR